MSQARFPLHMELESMCTNKPSFCEVAPVLAPTAVSRAIFTPLQPHCNPAPYFCAVLTPNPTHSDQGSDL